MPTNSKNRLRTACLRVQDGVYSGNDGLVEQLLREQPDLSSNVDAVMDLVYAEVVALEEAGRLPCVEDYCRRFPDWKDEIVRLFEVHRAWANDLEESASQGSTVPPGGRLTVNAKPEHCIGQYELGEEIGHGAAGVVFRAYQQGLDRPVALKVLRPFESEETRERFRAEAKAMAALRHPGFVQIHEVGSEGSYDYLAMELIEGGTLATALDQSTFDPRSSALLVQSLARAIQVAHDNGIVHRDLKPANVLLTKDGAPRISDFGLAHNTNGKEGRLTQTGAILGTPGYMAPEQIGSGTGEIGPATDIYALGAILYELLTGRPPYHAATIVEIVQQMRLSDPVPPRQLQPNVPLDLETICLKCLQTRSAASIHYGCGARR